VGFSEVLPWNGLHHHLLRGGAWIPGAQQGAVAAVASQQHTDSTPDCVQRTALTEETATSHAHWP